MIGNLLYPRFSYQWVISTVFELTLFASNLRLVSNPSRATIVDVVMDSFAYWVPINLGFISIKITSDHSYFLNLFFCAVFMKVTS